MRIYIILLLLFKFDKTQYKLAFLIKCFSFIKIFYSLFVLIKLL